MKVAICFSGHLRTFRDNNLLVRNLIKPLDADVFIHTYSTRNNPGQQWHSDHAGSDEHVTGTSLNWIAENMGRLVSIVRDPKTCGADYLPVEHKKMGFRHSLEQVHMLRNEHERKTGTRYDLVFGARFDLVLDQPIELPMPKPNTLYGSYNLTAIEKGVDGEVFTYGTPEVMDKVFVPAIPNFIAPKVEAMDFLGEQLLTDVRKHHGIAYQAHRVPVFLLRSGGTMLQVRI